MIVELLVWPRKAIYTHVLKSGLYPPRWSQWSIPSDFGLTAVMPACTSRVIPCHLTRPDVASRDSAYDRGIPSCTDESMAQMPTPATTTECGPALDTARGGLQAPAAALPCPCPVLPTSLRPHTDAQDLQVVLRTLGTRVVPAILTSSRGFSRVTFACQLARAHVYAAIPITLAWSVFIWSTPRPTLRLSPLLTGRWTVPTVMLQPCTTWPGSAITSRATDHPPRFYDSQVDSTGCPRPKQ